MDDSFLSQSDIDKLLGSVSEDHSSVTETNNFSKTGPQPYKLGLQEKIVRGRLPALELINERIARNLRLNLFNFIQKTVEVSVSPVKIQKYSEYTKNQVMPAALNIVSVKPLRGAALITIEPQLLFNIVDTMFGGKGQFHSRIEGRDFSDTERRLLSRLLESIFKSTEESWQSICPIKFESLRNEMQFQFVNIATPSEPIITTSFDIELNGLVSSFNFCYPYSMLEPIKDLLSSNLQNESGNTDKHWNKVLKENLNNVEVELHVELTTTQIMLKSLLGLKEGDVLILPEPDIVKGFVDNKLLFEGKVGTKNNNNAVLVENINMERN